MSYGTRVAIIDADEHVREGRLLLLQSQNQLQVVFESGDPAAALATLPDYLVDVILVEVRTPGWLPAKFVEELSEKLTAANNDALILVTADFFTPQLILELLQAGAAATYSREEPAEALLGKVKALSSGEVTVAGANLASLLAQTEAVARFHSRLASELSKLEAEQAKVLKLFLSGKSDSGISSELGLTKYRVTKFIEAMRELGGFRTRVQLALALIELGFDE